MPHLIHVRDTPPSLKGTRWPDAFRRFLLRRIVNRPRTQLVAVSDSAADYTATSLGLERSRVRTIVNGLALDRFLAVPNLNPAFQSQFVIACAGRLIADKGFDLIIRSVALLNIPKERVLVRIAGTGSAEPQLRSLATELGVESNLEFAGQVSDMPQFLGQADIFVHSSVAAEGMARVLIESQAAGRPVVTTDHAGAREAVVDGITGLVTPPSDPVALSAAIESLVRNRSRLVEMGDAARCRAEQMFPIGRVLAEVSDQYIQMLKG